MKTLNFYVFFILFLAYLFPANAQWMPRWEEVTLPLGYQGSDNSEYLDVFFLNSQPQYGWICGMDSRVLRTTNGGKSWAGIHVDGNSKYQLESIMFANPRVGYLSGPGDPNGNGIAGVLFKTIDSGKTWKNITPNLNGNQLWGMYLLDEDNIWVIGGGCPTSDVFGGRSGSNQSFYKSTNGGLNWNLATYKVSGNKLSDLVMYDKDGIGYASGSGGIWQTLDGGRHWAPISNTGGNDWQEEMCVNKNSFLVPVSPGCDGTTGGNGQLRFSTDLGKSWKKIVTQGSMYGAFLNDDLRGWGVGSNRSLYYTCDGGTNWELRNCGIKGNLDDIWFINDTTAYVVGSEVYRLVNAIGVNTVINIDTVYFCQGNPIEIKPKITKKKFNSWSNCTKSQTTTINVAGEYINYQYDSPCDTIFVNKTIALEYPRPKFEIKAKTTPPYCEGDTVILEIIPKYNKYHWKNLGTTINSNLDSSDIFLATKTSKFEISVSDTNCSTSINYQITFNPLPLPMILTDKNKACIDDSIRLYTSANYSKISWALDSTSNIISNEKLIYAKKDGNYYLIAENEYGCKSVSKPVFLQFTLDTNRLDILDLIQNQINFDSTVISQSSCKSVTVYNKSWKIFELNSPFLSNNLYFGLPQSNYPYYIEPFDSVKLQVCYTPFHIQKDIDTLLIPDVCNNHLVILTAKAIAESIFGETNCNLNWKVKINKFTPNQIDVKSLNYDAINQTLNLTIESGTTFDYIDIRMVNSIGQSVFNDKIVTGQSGIVSKLIDLRNISTGAYLLLIQNDNMTTCSSILLTK